MPKILKKRDKELCQYKGDALASMGVPYDTISTPHTFMAPWVNVSPYDRYLHRYLHRDLPPAFVWGADTCIDTCTAFVWGDP